MPGLYDLLAKFSQTHGASGYEENVRALVVREFKKLVDEIQITRLGSVVGIIRASEKSRAGRAIRKARAGNTPRVLVEAHMDEIGLMVTAIEDGFIRFDEIGYIDPRVLPAQNVLVHGRKTLAGVIGARPPHVLSAREKQKSLALDALFIDVGMSDARVRELVSPGDFITLDRAVVPLHNEFVAGKAFDDRSALVALIEMLRQLRDTEHAWDVYAVANVNEEDSAVYIGALTSTFQIRPQIAVCIDVTHAQQIGLSDVAAPRVGDGPCIARGANVHPFVFEKLRRAATGEVDGNGQAIPHQVTVYGGDTQTNGWMMQMAGEGVPTGLVEIPLRYMHSAVETIHLQDVARTAELLRVFVASLTVQDETALRGERFVRAADRPTRRKVRTTARRKR